SSEVVFQRCLLFFIVACHFLMRREVEDNEEKELEIFLQLSLHRAVSLFKILEHSTQKRIIKNLSPHKSAELLNEMQPDDRTAFLEDLPNEVVRELVKTLEPEERKITLSLLGYPDNSVGRLMTPDYILCTNTIPLQKY
ncbi:MAG: hypothetical protein ABI472_24610, partial [Ginsengibacter sp.]